ncbi:MAG: hypothetical protein JWO68_4276 [Actinomycetia bacterium]|nr:hypothetical protein [Actinomycetes bacterium]
MAAVSESARALRWGDYVFAATTKSSIDLWEEAHLSEAKTLLICGAGFDPRSLDVPEEVASQDWPNLTVIALRPGVSGDHQQAEENAESNRARLHELFGAQLTVLEPPLVSDPQAAGTLLSRQLVQEFGVLEFQTIIVDMSGLPSSISFVFLHLLLTEAGPSPKGMTPFKGDLLVTVSEDAAKDARIFASGLGDANTMPGLPRMPSNARTKIWVPVLGEGAEEELRSLATFISPGEICPVLPFPSSDPRRADDLMLSYRTFLFEEMAFEPRNVLYASETNPFDLYRQLVHLAERYERALQPLGQTTIIASEHTSKLLSLGVLLASHEANISIAHVRPTSYRLAEGPTVRARPSIYTAWLAGRPYELEPSGSNVVSQ